MLSGVCDHSTRTLKPDAWKHITLKLLRCDACVDIIDHALGEDAGAFHHPLAGNAAWHALNVWAVGPIDVFHDNPRGRAAPHYSTGEWLMAYRAHAYQVIDGAQTEIKVQTYGFASSR
jgi:hypothetical protein